MQYSSYFSPHNPLFLRGTGQNWAIIMTIKHQVGTIEKIFPNTSSLEFDYLSNTIDYVGLRVGGKIKNTVISFIYPRNQHQ